MLGRAIPEVGPGQARSLGAFSDRLASGDGNSSIGHMDDSSTVGLFLAWGMEERARVRKEE